MEALALLRDVSSAYRNLRTLQVEATIISESGDEDWTQRGESRVSFAYAAPDRIRFEQRGRHGRTQVADGEQWHTCSGEQIGPHPRYSVMPLARMPNLPHLFQAMFPFGGGNEPFLYQAIDEHVTSAEILREEDGCHVVSVRYEQDARMLARVLGEDGVRFWISQNNHMVLVRRGKLDSGGRPRMK